MANRSYLYSIDFDVNKGERKPGEKIYPLSEYNYSIPLSFKILVSQNAEIAPSLIWGMEHPIAIQGDFNKGKQKLLDFLDRLLHENLFEKIELQKQIAETEAFLSKNRLENTYLECCELYQLREDKVEVVVQNKELFEYEILKIDEEIEEYIKDFKTMKASIDQLQVELMALSKPKSGFLSKLFSSDKSSQVQELEKKINRLKHEMWKMLGIDYWRDVLYFDFDNE